MAALPTVMAGDQKSTPLVLFTVPQRDASRSVMAFVVLGLFFMILPGTLMGVLNLVKISAAHGSHLDPAFVQAHGHAQIFGWIGSFILGIGYFSLPAVRRKRFAGVDESWITLTLWAIGNGLHWVSGATAWHWRMILPVSAGLELTAFLIFFRSVAGHRSPNASSSPRFQPWMIVVIAGTFGFLAALLANLVECVRIAATAGEPSFPAAFDSAFLVLATWGFLVPFVWGFSARWMPVFMGLREPNPRLLLSAVAINPIAIVLFFVGYVPAACTLLLVAAFTAAVANHMFSGSLREPKTRAVHPSYPAFIRIAYCWSIVAAIIGVLAAFYDQHHGFWGASRHALTVGFLATMVITVGQRVLPHFAALRALFSPKLMLLSMLMLNVGCSIRVVAQVLAYENFSAAAWKWLPGSAGLEITALLFFAINLSISFAHRSNPHPQSES